MAQNLKDLLGLMLERDASDLHLTAKLPAQIRVDGELEPLSDKIFSAEEVKALCYEVIDLEHQGKFEEDKELDFSFSHGTEARFRGNLYWDKQKIAGAFRAIPYKIPRAEDLGIPDAAMELIHKPRGLVLVTGPTGSGKSTTLAAMIEEINQNQARHIITIEDPIEFLYDSKKSLINQREVGDDTTTFAQGLKHILRQDPDVVLVGEMRDLETIAAAIMISETGHLVFATLHTNNTVQTINRIIDVFPPHQQPQIRTQLSFILEGVLAQTLVKKKTGGRSLAMEIMTPTYAIRNLIREDKIHQIYSSMLTGQSESAMQTMNQCLVALVQDGTIAMETAMRHTTDPDELEKLIKGGPAPLKRLG